MLRRFPLYWLARLYLVFHISLFLWLPARSEETPLDHYVKAPDPSYRYRILKKQAHPNSTAYIVDMVSQTWRDPSEVNRTEWQHWLIVVRPKEVRHDTAFLFITGGSNDGKVPAGPSSTTRRIAEATDSVVAELRMVPNQPLIFTGEGKPRSEDAIIAYAWHQYLMTGDPTWLPRLPMTKAAVRAMDTISKIAATEDFGMLNIQKFVVAGGSKRGWTTWTTAAVDKRVIAIVPIVIDMLNLVPSFTHHYRAYGFFAPAVNDYTEMGIMNWMETPEFEQLLKIVEPYSYRDRYTMPKLIINATGDQFFLPDSWKFYYKDLPSEKHLRYVPNADHSLRDSDALETVVAFYQMILEDYPRPRYQWELTEDGAFIVRPIDRPREVRLWQATNPSARDFRVETIGKVWHSTRLSPQPDGSYIGRVSPPAQGWTAFFVELTYPGPGRFPLKVTTGVHVVPETLPHAPPEVETPPRGFLSKVSN